MTVPYLLTMGWAWFLLGAVSGALLGLGYHREDWWGGYGSWRRRMARLGHISFFGTGFLLLAAGLTASAAGFAPGWIGPALAAGAVGMPLFCFLSAWRKPWRHGFAVPVVGLTAGCVGMLFHLIGVAA